MSIRIRPAIQVEQAAIKRIIRNARLAPFNLHWQNFLVAVDGEEIVGVGQVKTHKDGTRELASIAVRPKYQRRGIASEIIKDLIKEEKGVLYLMCASDLESFYRRFEFLPVESREIPSSIGRMLRLGQWFTGIISFFLSRKFTIMAMKREP